MLMHMTRWFRILLLAVLLAPAAAQAFRPALEVCIESRENCCDDQGGEAASCAECHCCAAGAVTLAIPVAADVMDAPRTTPAPAPSADPPAAPRAEILHVPRSA
jgi:hypothetical protein